MYILIYELFLLNNKIKKERHVCGENTVPSKKIIILKQKPKL